MDYEEEMKTLECHYNWGIEKLAIEGGKDLTETLSKKSEELEGKTWTSLLVMVNAVYELHKKRGSSEAEEKLRKCLDAFENGDDNFFIEYKRAFQHVLFSIQLFLVIDNSSEDEIKELFNRIPRYSELSQNEKAAISGIKAYCLGEYGSDGRKLGLISARKAYEENPNEPEWSFMIGFALSRIRHYTFDIHITDEEINCIEKAYAVRKSLYFGTYLAQTYLDYKRMILYSFKDEFTTLSGIKKNELVKKYDKKAHQLFREVMEKADEDDVHILVRCAKGICQLKPYDSKTLNEVLLIIKKCLNIAPNYGLCHCVASDIYLLLKDYDLALKHSIEAEKVGDYFSSIRIIQLKKLLNIKVNAAEKFNRMLEEYPTESYIYQTHLLAISCYIFMERNLQLAVEHFLLVSKLDNMKREDYKLFDNWIKKRIDLCYILYNEVKCSIIRKLYKNYGEKLKLNEAIEVFKTKYPDVTDKTIDSRLVEDLKNPSLKKNRKK